MPKVSICVPTYKQLFFLRKTLDSIIMQNYQDYEVIVTDDTPDDSVKELVESYDFGNKLKYYKNESAMGSPENWNEAVRKSSGEYIKMLHHDDFFTYPSSLGDFVAMLDDNPETDFAFSAAVADNIKENRKWIHSPTEQQLSRLKEDPRNLFFVNFIGPPSSTIYRNRPGLVYDKKLKWVVDFDFYIQCLLKNPNFQFSDRPLITSVSGANHNVTNDCIDNGSVEVFEYLYLFQKLQKSEKISLPAFADFFRSLFEKYQVTSIRTIRNYGYTETVPLFLRKYLYKKQLRGALRKLKNFR